ncbi:hypothetical protein [Algibacter sp. 2305UL17-15]|uniref:hypothetical protein n=1 Tax=Algibacter sp. 2305UL17-15 TaxID=3231268 RepID=UPI0034582CA7
MKKVVYTLIFLFTVSTVFTGCREKKENDVEEIIDDAGEAIEDAADDVEDTIDDIEDEIE